MPKLSKVLLFSCLFYYLISTSNQLSIKDVKSPVDALQLAIERAIGEDAGKFINCSDVTKNVKYGDLVEVRRKGYFHWVMSLGQNDIINLQNPSFDDLSVATVFNNFTGLIQFTKLTELAGNDTCRINNKPKETARKNLKPYTIEQIRANVSRLHENDTRVYNIRDYNCEHFATELRFGKAFSSQIDAAKRVPTTMSRTLAYTLVMMFKQVKDNLTLPKPGGLIRDKVGDKIGSIFNQSG